MSCHISYIGVMFPFLTMYIIDFLTRFPCIAKLYMAVAWLTFHCSPSCSPSCRLNSAIIGTPITLFTTNYRYTHTPTASSRGRGKGTSQLVYIENHCGVHIHQLPMLETTTLFLSFKQLRKLVTFQRNVFIVFGNPEHLAAFVLT